MNDIISEENLDIESALREGCKEFMGIWFRVKSGVLIPRKETELLARTAIGVLKHIAAERENHRGVKAGPLRVIDMCCGAGNIACSIAAYVSGVTVWACDLAEEAVNLATENVTCLGMSDSVRVFRGDLFSALPHESIGGLVDAIVCNPPYISSGKLTRELAALCRSEPREAFDGGPYGLKIHEQVSKEAPRWLGPEGVLLFEFGLGQERQVKYILERTKLYGNIQFVSNSLAKPRVVTAHLIGKIDPHP
ncbi:MAG: peptide chain release factor N(5)-glutamine methyltransferase [Syntrophobacteraceae bacterium]|nr:peptide chain release factor N(5)-glutamine methyltransferase [Syntrophobacteraceae bacterium]